MTPISNTATELWNSNRKNQRTLVMADGSVVGWFGNSVLRPTTQLSSFILLLFDNHIPLCIDEDTHQAAATV